MKEMLTQHLPWVWFALAVVCFATEGMTMQLTTIWFAIAALVMVFLSLLPIAAVYQVCLFLILACTLLILTRPFALKKLKANKTKTNADALIGQKALVTQTIGELEKGEIKIEGKRWSAKSASGTGIEKGSECLIEKIEGVTCVVRKVQ